MDEITSKPARDGNQQNRIPRALYSRWCGTKISPLYFIDAAENQPSVVDIPEGKPRYSPKSIMIMNHDNLYSDDMFNGCQRRYKYKLILLTEKAGRH